MKTIYLGLLILLIAFLVVPQLEAQQTADPARYKLYNTHPIVTTRNYADNTVDTIPNLVISHWNEATDQSDRLGGASMASLKIATLDSMYAVIVIQELIGTVWTTILTDSIVTAVAFTKEFPIRSQNGESTAKLGGIFREILTFPAWRTQGVHDATDNPHYTASWEWKP